MGFSVPTRMAFWIYAPFIRVGAGSTLHNYIMKYI
jgi:hypothetical protein